VTVYHLGERRRPNRSAVKVQHIVGNLKCKALCGVRVDPADGDISWASCLVCRRKYRRITEAR